MVLLKGAEGNSAQILARLALTSTSQLSLAALGQQISKGQCLGSDQSSTAQAGLAERVSCSCVSTDSGRGVWHPSESQE